MVCLMFYLLETKGIIKLAMIKIYLTSRPPLSEENAYLLDKSHNKYISKKASWGPLTNVVLYKEISNRFEQHRFILAYAKGKWDTTKKKKIEVALFWLQISSQVHGTFTWDK